VCDVKGCRVRGLCAAVRWEVGKGSSHWRQTPPGIVGCHLQHSHSCTATRHLIPQGCVLENSRPQHGLLAAAVPHCAACRSGQVSAAEARGQGGTTCRVHHWQGLQRCGTHSSSRAQPGEQQGLHPTRHSWPLLWPSFTPPAAGIPC
jgi:hypothetical protein